MRILIVENDINVSNKMKKFIMAEGDHNVMITDDGSKALQLIKSSHFDLIFLDLLIYKINGVNLLKNIRHGSMCEETKIIITTIFPTVRTAVDCMKLGATDYWSKPFKIERIKGVLQCQ